MLSPVADAGQCLRAAKEHFSQSQSETQSQTQSETQSQTQSQTQPPGFTLPLPLDSLQRGAAPYGSEALGRSVRSSCCTGGA